MCIIDFNQDPNQIVNILNNLQPIRGICIFIDMCDSTQLKNECGINWIIKIGNTFQQALWSSPSIFRNNVIKLIGDEIMLFIPDDSLGNENYDTILNCLKDIINDFHNDSDLDITLRLKASIHYCTDVYKISFYNKNPNDYYGKDIDLTARLIKKAGPKRIILSNVFYHKLSCNKDKISDVYIEDFKGFNEPTEFRTIQY